MNKTTKNIQRLLAVTGVVALGATGFAQSTETEPVDDPATFVMAGGTLTFDVPQFNSALGTLNSVDFTLTPIFGAIQPNDLSLTAQTITDASVNSPAGSIVDSALGLTANWSGVQNPSGQTESITTTATSGYYTGDPQTFTFTAPAGSVTGISPTGYTGGGYVDLTFSSSATATPSGTGVPSKTFVGWIGDVGGELDVTYNYTPSEVPEPTTISLLATGVLGALAMRRRKV